MVGRLAASALSPSVFLRGDNSVVARHRTRNGAVEIRPAGIEPALHADPQTYGGQTMCGPLFLTVAGIGLLSVGTCLGFLTAALFATGAEPAKLAKPKMAVSIPDDTAELVWQAAESLYTLGSCLREGEDPFGPMADPARALHRVADHFPVLLRDAG